MSTVDDHDINELADRIRQQRALAAVAAGQEARSNAERRRVEEEKRRADEEAMPIRRLAGRFVQWAKQNDIPFNHHDTAWTLAVRTSYRTYKDTAIEHSSESVLAVDSSGVLNRSDLDFTIAEVKRGIAHHVAGSKARWDEANLADAPPASLPGSDSPSIGIRWLVGDAVDLIGALIVPAIVLALWTWFFSSAFSDWNNPLIYLGWVAISIAFAVASMSL